MARPRSPAPALWPSRSSLPVAAEGVWTLSNSGFAPASLGAPAVSGAGWTLVGTTCGPTLAKDASCSLGVRLVAGLVRGDYSLQLTASASPIAAALARVQRVVGPRLVILSDGFDTGPATLDHASWTAQGNAREIRYHNVGNATTERIGATALGVGFTYNHHVINPDTGATLRDAIDVIRQDIPTGTIELLHGETGRMRMRLQAGNAINPVQALVAGPNVFAAPPNQIGGFPLLSISATYTGLRSVAWTALPTANALNVATHSLTSPTNAAAGPTQNATLQNTGDLPLDGMAFAFVGANAASYQRNGGTCGTSLSPNATCTVGIRLVAGQFPATYQAAVRATATGLSATDSATISSEVFGPRLVLAIDNGASPTYSVAGGSASYNAQTGRIIQYNNVGYRAATGVTLTGSGLRRDGNAFQFASGETAAGRGFVWSIYRSDQLVFALRLDSNNMPSDVGQTPPRR